MGKRLSKIYTRTGDSGETGLGDGSRIAKDNQRVIAMGTVDELNSFIGLLIEEMKIDTGETQVLESCIDFLKTCQHRIFDLGGELSIPSYEIINGEHVSAIEVALDELNANLKPLENFILPGGSKLIATIHIARSICRRAERDVISLKRSETVNANAIKFLNRLSDYLFVTARYVALTLKVEEVLWQKG